MKSKMGRPKGRSLLEKNKILKMALLLLDTHGSDGLSMRNLALRLKVTPMALYNHYPNRSSLICSVSDLVYGEVTNAFKEFSGTTKEKIEFLLVSYFKAIIQHPNLAISLFETQGTFSSEAYNITQHLKELISSTKISTSKQIIWLNIFVDFTHGSSIATSKGCVTKKNIVNFVEIESKRFSKELNVLLDCMN